MDKQIHLTADRIIDEVIEIYTQTEIKGVERIKMRLNIVSLLEDLKQ